MSEIEYFRAHIERLNAAQPATESGRAARNQAVWELEKFIRELVKQDGHS